MLSQLSVLTFVFLCTTVVTTTEARRPKNILPAGGKIWAFLVASSEGWDNYRHQADVCHSYQVLHRNGIPDENIIVMMADDIANNPKNPTPGVIINAPNGSNVYQGVPIDYRGDDVTASNFLNILRGNKSAVDGIGSQRVIESGPNDHVFVFIADHGAPGFVAFPADNLWSKDLISVLNKMAKQSKFAKMAIFVEACESGSMFDGVLDDDLNIFAETAADPYESSLACYFDESRGTFLGDYFSVGWLKEAERENLQAVSLHHVFEAVRSDIKTSSHAEEYGDLDIGSMKMSKFVGFRTSDMMNSDGLANTNDTKITDAVYSMDVPLISLEKIIEIELDPVKLKELKMKRNALLKKRHTVDQIFNKIIQKIHLTPEQRGKVSQKRYRLDKTNFRCYEDLLNLFSNKCFNVVKNPYVFRLVHTFINICNFGWNAVREAHASIGTVCGKGKGYLHLRAV